MDANRRECSQEIRVHSRFFSRERLQPFYHDLQGDHQVPGAKFMEYPTEPDAPAAGFVNPLKSWYADGAFESVLRSWELGGNDRIVGILA